MSQALKDAINAYQTIPSPQSISFKRTTLPPPPPPLSTKQPPKVNAPKCPPQVQFKPLDQSPLDEDEEEEEDFGPEEPEVIKDGNVPFMTDPLTKKRTKMYNMLPKGTIVKHHRPEFIFLVGENKRRYG